MGIEKDVQKIRGEEFIQLRPRGQGFYPAGEDRTPDEQGEVEKYEADIERIQAYVKAARDVLYPTKEHRATRDEPRYLCKCKYVLDYGSLTKEKLVYLLADFKTLFSLDYQIHGTHREIYRRWHEERLEKKQDCGEEITKEEEKFGHYRRSFKIREIKEFEAEKERVDHLKAVFDKLAVWQADKLTLLPAIDFSEKPNIEGDLSKEQCHKIYQATLDYLKTMRSIANISEDAVKQIVALWYHASREEQTFPFCYMAVCTAKGSRLFTSSEEVDEKDVEGYLEAKDNHYRERPSRAQKRVDRIRFMKELIKIARLPTAVSAKNWRLFLQVYGACVSSVEEENLWQEIIRGDAEESGEECEIPPVEAQILCRRYLKECLPIEPERLFSYKAADLRLCQGGYAKFYRMHIAAIEECAKYLASKKLTDEAKEYLESYWAETKVDVSGAREFCRKVSRQFYWPPIEEKSQCSLYQFCRNLFPTEKGNITKIRRCVGDLKILITETAMRTVLTDQARSALRDSIKQELNSDKDAVDFQIEIPADLKRIESR